MENPSGAHRPEDRVLLVDDSRTLRQVIGAKLRKLGFAVEEAASGEEALARFKAGDIQLVVSDWMMPGMDGLELIRAIRAGEAEECFTYIILMTAKQDKAALGEGFAAGADDFIAKPVDTTELTARLSAGRRLVGLHNTLAAQKAQTDDAYAALKTVYGQLEADLAVASMLQRAYLPPAAQTVNGCRIASLCRFKGHVGGDHVGCFPIGEHALGAFSIDVSGHGVASCLLAIRLAELFAPRHQGDSIAFGRDGSGQAVARAPQDVLAELNSHGLLGEGHDLYFTMAYAVIDGPSGDVALCTAGHWPAIVQSRDGQIRFCEMATAPPVGLLQEAAFPATHFTLRPGERLILYSDGITEAERQDGEGQLGESGLRTLVEALGETPTDEMLPRLWAMLSEDGGQDRIDDDVSAIVIERPTGARLTLAS